MTDRLVTLYGTDEPLPEEITLKAGPISALLTGGALRNVRLQDVEVIRGLYFLVRDRNWATLVPAVKDLAVAQRADGFTVTFTCDGTTPSDGTRFVWRGRIEGSVASGIRFEAVGQAKADLVTARTGFIVLHPLEKVVGCPVAIEHSDGRIEQTAFPDLIDPLQPFFDIRAMTHEPIPGIRATCRMEGSDAWETEDQRNWLDASFKTYFRPLGLPWPYTVPAGEEIRQAISLTFEPGIAELAPAPAEGAVTVAVGDRTGRAMPEIGLAVMPEELDTALAVAGAVAPLGAQTLAVRVAADTKDLPGVLRKAAQLAAALGADPALEIVLPLKEAPEVELDLVAVAAAAAGLEPASVAVSPEVDLRSYPPSVDRPPSLPLEAIYAAARDAFPGVPLGGGMFSFFTELNRRRPPVELLDFVQHATAANVHAADDRSVMETLESLPHVFRSTRAFTGDLAYRVGPANIGMAFNPYGASTAPNPQRLKRTMVTDDPRAGALFGASWAAGYLARAAQGGLDGVTMMAPAGPFGVLGEDGPRPAFHVLAGFAALAGAPVLQTASSDPQRLLACAAQRGARRELWLANLTAGPLEVRIAGLRASSLQVLDERSPRAWSRREPGPQVCLGAYAVARLTG
jgi:hypothetical protein